MHRLFGDAFAYAFLEQGVALDGAGLGDLPLDFLRIIDTLCTELDLGAAPEDLFALRFAGGMAAASEQGRFHEDEEGEEGEEAQAG